MKTTYLILVSALLSLTLYGCSGKNDEPLAKIGNAVITQGEYERKMQEITPQYQAYLSTENGKKQFLQILIREKLILAAAQSSGIQKDDFFKKEVKRMDREMRLKQQEFREYLLTKMWLEQLSKEGEISVSEDEIKDYYERFPYEVSISHILLGSPNNAQELLKDIRRERNFNAAAKAYSLDTETGANGGKIAPFIMGEFLPELEAPASKMKNGEIQGVFKSKLGYHILRKDDEKKLSLDEAKERIYKIIEKEKLDAYLESLQKKYKVEVLNEKYKYN